MSRRLITAVVAAAGLAALPSAAAKGYPDVEIYRVVPGGAARNLTMNPALDTAPAPSPDGKRIAFVSNRDGQPEVHVMPAAGGAPTRLTTSPFDDEIVAWNDAGSTAVAWSPDSKRIAFDVQNASFPPTCMKNCVAWSVYLVNADGTGLHSIATEARSPSWSHDGRLLAYEDGVTPFGEATGIAIDRLDGTRVRVAGFNADATVGPSWSPRRNEVEFQSNAAVYTIRADGTRRHRLARGSNAAWSPDGSSLVFVRDGRIHRMTRTGTGRRAVGRTRPASFPVWSPDGRSIAFLSGGRLYVVASAGGGVRRLTNAPTGASIEGGPAWLRRTRAILYAVRVA